MASLSTALKGKEVKLDALQIFCQRCKVLCVLKYLCSDKYNFTTPMSLKAEQRV